MSRESFRSGDFSEEEVMRPVENKIELRERGSLVTAASEQGGRSHQEDRYIAEYVEHDGRKFWLLAVMDGHLGEDTAELAARALRPSFEAALLKHKDLEKSLRETVRHLDVATRNLEMGSTVSLVAIPDGEAKAYVAILGDSPVVIRDREDRLNISPEHNARTNIKEREAAVARGAEYAGGYLYGDHGVLQMSRALGNRGLHSILNREPETYAVDLGENSFVLVASDGVFDPHHDENPEVQTGIFTRFIRDEKWEAKEIVQDALRRKTRDNVTAVLWKPEAR